MKSYIKQKQEEERLNAWADLIWGALLALLVIGLTLTLTYILLFITFPA